MNRQCFDSRKTFFLLLQYRAANLNHLIFITIIILIFLMENQLFNCFMIAVTIDIEVSIFVSGKHLYCLKYCCW